MRTPVWAAIIFTQSSMRVSVRRPRKSIFRRPMRSTPCMSNWVVMPSALPLNDARGRYSVSGRGAITTPAAWVDACRVVPSSRREMSISSLTFGSFWYASWRAGDSASALSSVIFRSKGIIFAILSTSA